MADVERNNTSLGLWVPAFAGTTPKMTRGSGQARAARSSNN